MEKERNRADKAIGEKKATQNKQVIKLFKTEGYK
jgi:hypothetical protein